MDFPPLYLSPVALGGLLVPRLPHQPLILEAECSLLLRLPQVMDLSLQRGNFAPKLNTARGDCTASIRDYQSHSEHGTYMEAKGDPPQHSHCQCTGMRV